MLIQPFSFKLTRLSRLFVVLLISTCFIILIVNRTVDFKLYQTKLEHPVVYVNQPVSTINGLTVILLWTDYYEDPTWGGLTEQILPCGCLITRDRALLPQASIVVFHWRTFDATDVPNKYLNQTWIWHHIESPAYTKRIRLLQQFKEHIDCWASYRQDSDFVVDYGRYERLDKPREVKKVSVSSKPKWIAWMVSNCGAKSGRDEFVRQLANYIPVDIYGYCGTLRCSGYSHFRERECWEMIGKDYKYYLSFENSICKDYFTEKVIEVLNQDLIPIVMGGADYGKLVPNNSIIDSRKFGSPKYLAMFLRSLATDEDRYNSYFQWKANYSAFLRIPTHYNEIFCEICTTIKNTNGNSCRGKREDLIDWWFKDSCHNPWRFDQDTYL